MAKTMAVVGAGRAGQTLARALRRRGYRVTAVLARRARTARRAARFIGSGKPGTRLTAKSSAEIVLVAVPDPALAGVARQLAQLEWTWRGKVVLHTSGTLSARVLAPVRRRGAAVASMHPLFPFAQALKLFPRGVFFGVEGDRRAVAQARRLVRALGGTALTVRSARKSLYHAAAALAAGQMMTLLDLASRALLRTGVAKAQARRALLPLAQATLDAYAERGARSWVGPLARGDAKTVGAHLKALGKVSRRHREAYALLGRVALEIYGGRGIRGSRGSRGSREVRRLRRLLGM